MRTSSWLAQIIPLVEICSAASSKRGLVFTPNAEHAGDNKLWVQSGSDLTWYYNYQSSPSPAYSSLSQDQFEFIPMMWGIGSDPNDTKFLTDVKKLIDDGTKIKHVLGFNEPDTSSAYGGSNIKPADAALAWVANFEPLGKMGVKLGLPACTGGWDSLPWLKQFLGNCSELVSTGKDKKNCTWDFLPVHWYDNFAGLASHIGEQYAFAHQDLKPTQEFYNQTIDYFDKLDSIGRYSYFGAFRSTNSNVGANAAFLDKSGKLTDIGSWYLGFAATGVTPESSKAALLEPTVGSLILGVIAGILVGSL
ncbi:Alkali-sensitive linkage protein 1 [Metarhizium anisopliae]|nr:Alkali-sensitive linkage protein 1 [Metarhizium anisopliae]